MAKNKNGTPVEAEAPQFVIGYPSAQGGAELRTVSLDEHVKYTLRAALLSHQGERSMLPSCGSRVRDLLFRPLTTALKTELRAAIEDAIARGEPRVEIENVVLDQDRQFSERILVNLSYRILQTQKRDQFSLSLRT